MTVDLFYSWAPEEKNRGNLQLRERPLYWYDALINVIQTQTVVVLSVGMQNSWIQSELHFFIPQITFTTEESATDSVLLLSFFNQDFFDSEYIVMCIHYV